MRCLYYDAHSIFCSRIINFVGCVYSLAVVPAAIYTLYLDFLSSHPYPAPVLSWEIYSHTMFHISLEISSFPFSWITCGQNLQGMGVDVAELWFPSSFIYLGTIRNTEFFTFKTIGVPICHMPRMQLTGIIATNRFETSAVHGRGSLKLAVCDCCHLS